MIRGRAKADGEHRARALRDAEREARGLTLEEIEERIAKILEDPLRRFQDHGELVALVALRESWGPSAAA